MLDAFRRDSTANGRLLATYLPAASPQDDYHGDRWVGTSHESDTPGVVRHSLAWIAEQCLRRDLRLTELPTPAFDDQSWLRVEHATPPSTARGALGVQRLDAESE